jgi:hypothetical protein
MITIGDEEEEEQQKRRQRLLLLPLLQLGLSVMTDLGVVMRSRKARQQQHP